MTANVRFTGTRRDDVIRPSFLSLGVSKPAAVTAGPEKRQTRIRAGAGDDVIAGGGGPDFIKGQKGDDRLFGGDGDDGLRGGTGADRLVGGDGNDRYYIVDNKDMVVEAAEAGYDRVRYAAGRPLYTARSRRRFVIYIFQPITALFEIGNNLANEISGRQDNSLYRGLGGNDTIISFGSGAKIYGGRGDDYLSSGSGRDVLVCGGGADTVYAFDGADRVFGGSGDDSLNGWDGRDTIRGQGGTTPSGRLVRERRRRQRARPPLWRSRPR